VALLRRFAMPTLCHFEIPADDIKKIRTFYSRLFDWEMKRTELENEYWIFKTKKLNGEKGVSGAIEKQHSPQQAITCCFCVESIEEYSAKIKELGGEVFVEKSAVPGRGYYAYCLDPEGRCFVIWKDDTSAK
jgi:predicted enzyme related to lactoylglutathione lyase